MDIVAVLISTTYHAQSPSSRMNERVGAWMWENRNHYTGISVLPYDNGSYVQAPFEDCTKEVYEEMVKHLHAIDLTQVKEIDDNTNLTDQAACAGGACEIDIPKVA